MGEPEQQILQMLEDGIISVAEAEKLLSALGPSDTIKSVAGDVVLAPDVPSEEPFTPPPSVERFRRLWRVPFFIAGGSLILSGAGLILMYLSTGQVAIFGFLCVWSIFVLALLVVAIILLAKQVPWLHIRVREKHGRRIAISLPLPLNLTRWGVGLAKRIVPGTQAANLDMAEHFVKAMKDDPDRKPFVIDVDDDDGDKVQIFFGW
jgi:hypothetical protein